MISSGGNRFPAKGSGATISRGGCCPATAPVTTSIRTASVCNTVGFMAFLRSRRVCRGLKCLESHERCPDTRHGSQDVASRNEQQHFGRRAPCHELRCRLEVGPALSMQQDHGDDHGSGGARRCDRPANPGLATTGPRCGGCPHTLERRNGALSLVMQLSEDAPQLFVVRASLH